MQRNALIALLSASVLASIFGTDGCSSNSNGGSSGNAGGSSGTGGGTTSAANGSGGTGHGSSSSGTSSAKGGSSGGTGASSSGAAGSSSADGGVCTTQTMTACGGSVVGTWKVTSSCLKVAGNLDLEVAGTACDTTPVTGSLQVAGTWSATSNGTYSDETVTSGNEQFPLASSCLVISSTPVDCSGAAGLLTTVLGYSSIDCPSSADGGCTCSAVANQKGGLGQLSMSPSTSGTYTTSDNVVTLSGDLGDTKYSYCVSGNTLTLTPQSDKPTLTGTVVFEKTGSTGTGGSSGAGGASGSGSKGSGGSGGSGGTTSGGPGGATGSNSSGSTGSGGSSGTTSSTGPCDIYAAGSTPCVAAHSVVRALYGSYNGKLYQVRRSDNTTKDILTASAGGIADTTPEDTFCAGSTCVLTVVYDQTGKGNDLWYQGSTEVPASTQSSPAKATTDSVTVGGHKVYSLYISPGNCYWHDGSKSGMAIGSEPEGMYMVTSSRHANAGCCFDYGNSETTRSADVGGAMDALNISTTNAWGSGAGSGPWIMADLEWGLFAQGDSKKNSSDPTQTAAFVTAVLRNNGSTEYAIRGGDAASGALTTYYKGSVPYNPMKKQGALILGCGGDCCKPSGGANASSGIFFEGAIVSGYPTDATENAVQANIVTAGYGK